MSKTPEYLSAMTIIELAVLDASYSGSAPTEIPHISSASSWISGFGHDFRLMCYLAGRDHEFPGGKFIAGRIGGNALRIVSVQT